LGRESVCELNDSDHDSPSVAGDAFLYSNWKSDRWLKTTVSWPRTRSATRNGAPRCEVVDEDVGDDVPRVIRLVHAQAHDALGAVGRELDAQRGGFTDRGEVGAPSPAARDGLPPPGDRVDLARGALGSIAVAFAEGGRVAFLEVVLLEAVHVRGGRERQERHERHDRTPAPRAHGGWWRVLFWTIDRRGLRRQDGDLGFS